MDARSLSGRKGCLLISGAYPPVKHSGVFRVAAIGRHLESVGWDIQVITASDRYSEVDHYPEDEELPAGDVVRVDWNPQRNADSHGERLRRHLIRLPILSGLVQRWERERLAERIWSNAKEKLRSESLSVVVVSSPPALSVLVGQIAARELRIPLIIDLRDPWTYNIGAIYRSRLDLLILKQVEAKALADAVLVIANTETARQSMLRDFRLTPEKIVVLPNGYDEASCGAAERRARSQVINRRQFKVVYAGLSSSHLDPPRRGGELKRLLGLDIEPVSADWTVRSPLYVLEALRLMCTDRPDVAKNLVLQWIGPISEDTKRLFVDYSALFQVEAPGAVSEPEALDYIFNGDLLVLLQVGMRRDGSEECISIPGKLYSYLRAGKPILSTAASREIEDLLSNVPGASHAGARDVPSIAKVVAEQYDKWQKSVDAHAFANPTAFVQRFDRSRQMECLDRWLSDIVCASSTAAR